MQNFSMKKISLVLLLILTMIISVACNNTPTQSNDVDGQGQDDSSNVESPGQEVDLMVSAAISLTDALEEIKTLYQKDNPHINIIYNFGASGALMQQIEEGAPVDIFLSAAQRQMDQLEDKDFLLADSRVDFIGNDLVLIVNRNYKDSIKSVDDLLNLADEKIAMGEPESVPAGKYTAETLTSLGIYDDLLDKIVFTKNVRQVVTYVDSENAVAGFSYGSDAVIANNSVVAEIIKEDSHEPIVYPAAIIKYGSNIDESQDFLSFILGDQARDIFVKHGFSKTD